MNKYDPKYWKHGNNITVEQFCRYVMQQIPRDVVFYVSAVLICAITAARFMDFLCCFPNRIFWNKIIFTCHMGRSGI